jgi:hypothetical protein
LKENAMSLNEILEQAKLLSVEERKELAKQLIDMMDAPPVELNDLGEHWGQSLNRLLEELGAIEMKYPEIEDPVEWVKHLRAEQRNHRLLDEGTEE